MSNKLMIIAMFFMFFLHSSCAVLFEQPASRPPDGIYRSDVFEGITQEIYVESEHNDIIIYPLVKTGQKLSIHEEIAPLSLTAKTGQTPEYGNIRLVQPSFDLDLMTFPVKFRPGTSLFPEQLNSGINGALYVGYRRDLYKLNYSTTLADKHVMQTGHFGYSIGVFTGIGATYITPFVTDHHTEKEYDGVVWSNGLAGIIAVNQFTVGLGIGWDYLTDTNKSHWIYQKKPWLGIAIGINLN